MSATESGTTVTIQTVANPSGLIVGDNVTVGAVKIGSSFADNGYDGRFVVTGIPNSTRSIHGRFHRIGRGNGWNGSS